MHTRLFQDYKDLFDLITNTWRRIDRLTKIRICLQTSACTFGYSLLILYAIRTITI